MDFISWRRLKRTFSSFRIFLIFLAVVLVHHYLFKKNKTAIPGREKSRPSESVIKIPEAVPVLGDNDQSKRVIKAFRHCWNGYKQHAWGYDELHPISKSGSNWFSLGLTIVDALDTAYLLGQMEIFQEAAEWVSNKLVFDYQEGESNIFEITIRVLGGLIATHNLSKDPIFLSKAVELADKLLIAFDTPSGIPLSSINLKNNLAIKSYGGASTAEATTLQMEFKYLTYLTKDSRYWNAAQKIMQTVFKQDVSDGLVPIYMDTNSGKFLGGEIRLGSRGDSYYEYLAKQWLLTNQTEKVYKKEYRKSMTGVRKVLLRMSKPNNLLFVGETDSQRSFVSPKMDHLVCFLPGTLAWGATQGKFVSKRDRLQMDPVDLRDLELAEELARSCYQMYAQTESGLAPEIVFWKETTWIEGDDSDQKRLLEYHQNEFVDTKFPLPLRNSVPYDDENDNDTRFGAILRKKVSDTDFTIHPRDGHNLLRPETVESLFILYRITGKQIYRDWGWKIFEAFEKHCQVEGGYTSLQDVRIVPPPKQDKMETFFVGETLKYLYLLLTDKPLVPLDKFIFNTEAHPFPVFDFTKSTKDLALLKELLILKE